MPFPRKALLMTAVLLIGVAAFLVWKQSDNDRAGGWGAELEGFIPARNSSSKAGKSEAADETDRAARLENRGREFQAEATTLEILKEETRALFYQSEARRKSLLADKVGSEAHSYLIGIREPTASESKELRSHIAAALKSLDHSPDDKEAFDVWLTDLIDSVDPFGVNGKKAVLIAVPEDPFAATLGVINPVDDFESETRRYSESSDAFEIKGAHIVGGGAEDGERLDMLRVK